MNKEADLGPKTQSKYDEINGEEQIRYSRWTLISPKEINNVYMFPSSGTIIELSTLIHKYDD